MSQELSTRIGSHLMLIWTWEIILQVLEAAVSISGIKKKYIQFFSVGWDPLSKFPHGPHFSMIYLLTCTIPQLASAPR